MNRARQYGYIPQHILFILISLANFLATLAFCGERLSTESNFSPQLKKDQLGIIELKQDCAFVAVPASRADFLIKMLNNSRLKKKKVKIVEV